MRERAMRDRSEKEGALMAHSEDLNISTLDVNRDILRIFKIDDIPMITEVHIILKAGEIPTLIINKIVDGVEETEEIEYELVPKATE